MKFLYVFLLMFLAIFGLAMLLHLFTKALLDGASRRFDVSVRDCDDIEEFVEQAGKSAFIGNINIIETDDTGRAEALAEKYENVSVEQQGR